jgi:hypothetical protein
MELLEHAKTHKTWSALWAALLIFWFIGFVYYCNKLDDVVYKGRPFYTEIVGIQDAYKHTPGQYADDGRPYPALMLCPGLGGNLTDIDCELCHIPRQGSESTDPFCEESHTYPAYYDADFTNCFLVNWEQKALEGHGTHFSCTLKTINTKTSRLYLLDPKWMDLIPQPTEGDPKPHHPDPRYWPNGMVQRTMPLGSRTLVELARSIYRFLNKVDVASFTTLDAENYVTPDSPDSISLTIYYGNFVEMRYTESGDVTTHFDFWYWIGFLGGISMFVYVLHSVCYGVISLALGWKEEDGSINYM